MGKNLNWAVLLGCPLGTTAVCAALEKAAVRKATVAVGGSSEGSKGFLYSVAVSREGPGRHARKLESEGGKAILATLE